MDFSNVLVLTLFIILAYGMGYTRSKDESWREWLNGFFD